jgi:hypothetical protein
MLQRVCIAAVLLLACARTPFEETPRGKAAAAAQELEFKLCSGQMEKIFNPAASPTEQNCFAQWAANMCEAKSWIAYWEEAGVRSNNIFWQQKIALARTKRSEVDSEYRTCLQYAAQGS